ncbi:MAG TPA: AI-2E family transporter [Bacteriovoracaceae bacterium]|nr:AI-2E family transporter [Bacteriovoracaceae bacterium]
MERVKITNSTILFAVFLVVGLAVAYYASYVLLTALIGIGIGTLLSPILNKLENRFSFPRPLSAFIVFLGLLILFSGIIASLYFLLAEQVNTLTDRAPQIVERLDGFVTGLFDKYPWLREQVDQVDVGKTAQTSAKSIFTGFKLGIVAISGAIFALIIGLYTAVNSKEYYRSLLEAIPPRHKQKSSEILTKCSLVLWDWFRAQLLDMIIVGTLTGIGLWICKIEYWAVFGLLTAVVGIIPYIGIFLVVIVASLITLASDPGQVPWVLLVFGVTQQLEGNFILPMVMKDKVELPVVPLLVFMLLLGNFFGILGVFLAPPVFAILRTVYLMVYLPWINSKTSSQLDKSELKLTT